MKSSIAMEKATFKEKQTISTATGTVRSEVLHFEHRFVWRWNLDTSEIRSELPLKFWNVVLE